MGVLHRANGVWLGTQLTLREHHVGATFCRVKDAGGEKKRGCLQIFEMAHCRRIVHVATL
jgi:hypothetical protein